MTDSEYIQSLLNDKEGDQLAFFENFTNQKIAETVCAFLNGNGGRILVGVSKIKDLIFQASAIQENFRDLRTYIYNSISPESLISIRPEQINNQVLVLIEVIEGTKKPYSINNRCFIREGKMTRIADDNQMSNLIRDRRKEEYNWENLPVLEAQLEDLDLEEIHQAIESSNNVGRSSRFKTDDVLSFLRHFQLYRDNKFTNAAIVLFGKEPTYFIPQCRERIIFFGDTKSSESYKDMVIIEDNLFKSFRRIQDYFKKNLPMQSHFSDASWQRVDAPKYPTKALDEAVINAMMHRDYSDPTGEVLIGIYSDKIEVINSGELPKPLKGQDLKKSHRSIPPNPVITHIVFLCGMIEKVGRGTVLIAELFEENDLDSPQWTSRNGGTTLVLPGIPKKIELNDRIISFLKALQTSDSFTREEYELFLKGKISEKTARNDLSKSVDGEWVNKSGEGPATRYTRTSKELPDFTG